MKPLKVKNYGSIPHLLGSKLGKTDKYIDKGQHRILTEKTRGASDFVIVVEKYDGSNVGIAKINGNIIALTRSGYLAETSPYQQHKVFAEWVKKQKDRFDFIGEGERLTGEWLLQVHSIKYTIKGEPFVAFDYFTADNKRVNYSRFIKIAESINITLPRFIHASFSALSIEAAMLGLHQQNDHPIQTDTPEGVVYRVERNNIFDFAAKFVRADFEPGKYCIGKKELIWNVPIETILK